MEVGLSHRVRQPREKEKLGHPARPRGNATGFGPGRKGESSDRRRRAPNWGDMLGRDTTSKSGQHRRRDRQARYLIIVVYAIVMLADAYDVRNAFSRFQIPSVGRKCIAIGLPMARAKNIFIRNFPVHDNEILTTSQLRMQSLSHAYGLSNVCAFLECGHPKFYRGSIWEKYIRFSSNGWMSSSGSISKFWSVIHVEDNSCRPHFRVFSWRFPRIGEMAGEDHVGPYWPLKLVAYRNDPSTFIASKVPVGISNSLESYSVGISTGDPEADGNYRVHNYEKSDNAFHDRTPFLASFCAVFLGFLFFGWGGWWWNGFYDYPKGWPGGGFEHHQLHHWSRFVGVRNHQNFELARS